MPSKFRPSRIVRLLLVVLGMSAFACESLGASTSPPLLPGRLNTGALPPAMRSNVPSTASSPSLLPSNVRSHIRGVVGAGLTTGLGLLTSCGGQVGSAFAVEPTDFELYIDKGNRFSVSFPPGWTKFEKLPPSPSLVKYAPEESLLVGNCFAEGTSMGVTRTAATRLLKDFNIEWWFAPLESIGDVGSPELVAELLIRQRQGDFEGKSGSAEIRNSIFEKNSVLFEFDTPLAESVNRRTIAKAIFHPAPPNSKTQSSIYVVWISALVSVMESSYREKIDNFRDSFVLLG